MEDWRQKEADEIKQDIQYLQKMLPESGMVMPAIFYGLDNNHDSNSRYITPLDLPTLTEYLFWGANFRRSKVHSCFIQDELQDDSGVGVDAAITRVYLELDNSAVSTNRLHGTFDVTVSKGMDLEPFDVELSGLKVRKIGSEVLYSIDSDPVEGIRKIDVLTGEMLGGRYQILTKRPFSTQDAFGYLKKELNFESTHDYLDRYQKLFLEALGQRAEKIQKENLERLSAS